MRENVKILLINPEDIQAHSRVSEANPFAGLAYIATYLEHIYKDDLSVEVVEMLPQQMKIADIAKLVKKERIDICGITSKTYNFYFAELVARAVKEVSPSTIVIFGGAHATALPGEVADKEYVDGVVPGEGELVFRDIVGNVINGKSPFDGVNEVWRKADGEMIRGCGSRVIEDLDILPTPEWGKYYNLDRYDRHYDNESGKFHLLIPVFASRSCPYMCHFCQPVLTRKYRTRSVPKLLEEIHHLIDRYSISRIYFDDSIFGVKKQWFQEFCNGYINEGLHKKVEWGFETNVNCVDPDLMRMAKAAGCSYVYFGMESASDTVLTKIGKGATKQKLIYAVETAKKASIREVSGSFIFGMPYETSETAKETIEFIRESKIDRININIVDVYPGTELYSMVENQVGGIRWIPDKKDKWDACGRTLVKTLVNDLDTPEKLTNLYMQSLEILHDKYRRNMYNYIRKAFKYFFFYMIHNRRKLLYTTKSTITAYTSRITGKVRSRSS